MLSCVLQGDKGPPGKVGPPVSALHVFFSSLTFDSSSTCCPLTNMFCF